MNAIAKKKMIVLLVMMDILYFQYLWALVENAKKEKFLMKYMNVLLVMKTVKLVN